MANDWIPMRCDLMEDPAVIAISVALGLDEHGVVGRLHRLWSWANKHLTGGNATGVTSQWVDRYLSTPGFAAAMLHAGWLRERSEGIEFPHFDRWNSQTAKQRALTARRVAAHKQKGNARGNAAGVSGALPTEEKRREEGKKKPPDPPAGGGSKPPPFDPLAAELPHRSPRFATAWAEWVQHRREKKDPLTPTTVRKQLRTLAELAEPQAIACIEHSIGNGWLGLFPDDFRGTGKARARHPPMTAGDREMQDYRTHLGGMLDE